MGKNVRKNNLSFIISQIHYVTYITYLQIYALIYSIKFRSESNQYAADDVAGVGVALICENPADTSKLYRYEYRSYAEPHDWGSWRDMNGAGGCGDGWMVGFRTNVEYHCSCNIFLRPSCCKDDTALNCVQIKCSNGQILEPADCRIWGSGWPAWNSGMECPDGTYVCGWNEKFEENEIVDDETGLNAVRFQCCGFTASPTNQPSGDPTAAPSYSPTVKSLIHILVFLNMYSGAEWLLSCMYCVCLECHGVER